MNTFADLTTATEYLGGTVTRHSETGDVVISLSPRLARRLNNAPSVSTYPTEQAAVDSPVGFGLLYAHAEALHPPVYRGPTCGTSHRDPGCNCRTCSEYLAAKGF